MYRRDFKRVCERCGLVYRASQTRKQWDGMIVCLADFEERHPQDFVTGRADSQNVPDPRPEPVDTLIGPLSTVTTAATNAGLFALTVESSVRFLIGDHIGVSLDDGSIYRATLGGVPTSTSLQLTTALPGRVPVGARVVNYSAVSEADIG